MIASLIGGLCSFINFIMNWLDPFSVLFMAKAGVTVTTIWHEDEVDSFRFLHP